MLFHGAKSSFDEAVIIFQKPRVNPARDKSGLLSNNNKFPSSAHNSIVAARVECYNYRFHQFVSVLICTKV